MALTLRSNRVLNVLCQHLSMPQQPRTKFVLTFRLVFCREICNDVDVAAQGLRWLANRVCLMFSIA